MRFLGRSLIGLFLVAMTLGLLALAGNTVWGALQDRWAKEDRQRPARERVFAVNVIPAEVQTIAPVLTVFGEVQSRRVFEVRAPVGGTIVTLADGFEDGGRVEAGQLLLRVDPADAQTNLSVAKADLREAEADLRDAMRLRDLAAEEVTAAERQAGLRAQALRRQEDLVTRGVGTEAAVETAALALSAAEQAVLARKQAFAQAESRIETAQTTVERRQIALAERERALAETEVYAEFAGMLSDVAVLEGGLIGANERVARIIDADALDVTFRLSTAQHARLLETSGDLIAAPVDVVLDVFGLDLRAKGTITREAPAVGEGQTGRQVFARLDAARGFRPGDFVRVEVAEPALDRVVRLPAAALNAQGSVLVLGEEDRLKEVAVTLIRRQGDDVLVRARALRDREVVAERTPLLGAGIKVRPLRQQDGAAAAVPTEPEMIALDPERRARIIAFVEGNGFIPADVKKRLLGELAKDEVRAATVARIEARMGS